MTPVRTLQRALSFFASVIRSGETWTPECGRTLNQAAIAIDVQESLIKQLRQALARLERHVRVLPEDMDQKDSPMAEAVSALRRAEEIMDDIS